MGILFGGPTPQDGKSAYDLAVDNGYIGTEAQWLATLVGGDGSSTYQIWLAAGNTGTVAQFLASLQGPPGLQGIQGPPGADPVIVNYTFGYGTNEAQNLNFISGSYAQLGSIIIVNGVFNASATTGKFRLPLPVKYATIISIQYAGLGGSLEGIVVPAGSVTVNFNFSVFGTNRAFSATYFKV